MPGNSDTRTTASYSLPPATVDKINRVASATGLKKSAVVLMALRDSTWLAKQSLLSIGHEPG